MTEIADFKNQLKMLIQLQKVDSEAFDLKTQKESFPAKIKALDDSLEQKKTLMETTDNELKKTQLSKNDKERELEEREGKIKKHEGDLYQIKTNKEYAALKQEINSIKADASLIEEEIISFLDKIDTLNEKSEQEKRKFEREKEMCEREKAVIKQKEEKISAELNSLIPKRAEFVNAISVDILNRYEKILKNRGRTALAAVKNNFCNECNMQLRPQIVNEATLKKDIVFCENCGRILYAED